MGKKTLFGYLYSFVLFLCPGMSYAEIVSELAGDNQNKYVLANEFSIIAGDIKVENGNFTGVPFWRSSYSTYKINRKLLNDSFEHVLVSPKAIKINGADT